MSTKAKLLIMGLIITLVLGASFALVYKVHLDRKANEKVETVSKDKDAVAKNIVNKEVKSASDSSEDATSKANKQSSVIETKVYRKVLDCIIDYSTGVERLNARYESKQADYLLSITKKHKEGIEEILNDDLPTPLKKPVLEYYKTITGVYNTAHDWQAGNITESEADEAIDGFVSKWDKSAGEIKDICKYYGVYATQR